MVKVIRGMAKKEFGGSFQFPGLMVAILSD